MSDIIKVGVVGFGLSATAFHIPFFRSTPGFKIICVLERSGDKVHDFFQGSVKTSRNMESLLEEDIDLVVITTPPATHFDLAAAALKKRKHVLLEKPAAIESKQVLQLIHLSEENGVKLCVFQNRRYDSDFLTVKSLVESGKLGRICEYEANFDKFRLEVRENLWKEDPNQEGTGILYDLGSHLIDQAITLFGLPDSISASLYFERDGTKIVDAFQLTLGYKSKNRDKEGEEKNSFHVLLRSSTIIKHPRPRFALYGTKGSFVKYGLDVQESQLRAGTLPSQPGFGIESKEQEGKLFIYDKDVKFEGNLETHKGDYSEFFLKLAESIKNPHVHPPVTPVSAYNVIRIIELAQQSYQEKRVVLFN